MFEGFQKEMVSFFVALSMNNHKAFFEDNKNAFERYVKRPLYELCNTLSPVVRAIDPLLDVRPERSVSRIYRDVRFRKDKSPFRDYMWIGFRRTGESREETCGFYFDISATEAHWGCGYYHAQKETMQNLREMILEKPKDVLSVLEEEKFVSSFALMGDRYVKKYVPPVGMPETLSSLYPMKNVYAEHSVKDMDLLFSKDLPEHIVDGFQTLSGFYTLLRGCMTRKAREESK